MAIYRHCKTIKLLQVVGVVELPPTNHYPGSQWAYPNLPSQLDQQQRRASWKPYRPGTHFGWVDSR
ncbi:hypothetical protein OOU_Y34scaffold00820g5 [Pyricularia oryzae Y34]|uniref:Uncharacterized protein n=2 Tax=Pyricularia oryzae TaxID=318829 RepID=A0AA97NPQ4_PYRO3|nr:hypothetical protein OOU_Y34scaffold00820g5 [Pyricularia oryzae Y34]